MQEDSTNHALHPSGNADCAFCDRFIYYEFKFIINILNFKFFYSKNYTIVKKYNFDRLYCNKD